MRRSYDIMTERLGLRSWKPEDLKPFAALNADPVVMEFFPKTLNEEETSEFMDKNNKELKEKGYGLWAVDEIESGDFVGYMGFHYTNFESFFTPCIEIAWRLGFQYWGKGYATEGSLACLERGFVKLGFDKVFSFTAKVNQRSENVMKKIGMTKVGEFNHPNVPKDSRLNRHVLYRIQKEELFGGI